MTIRRDLDRMEKENIVIRTHGGARLITNNMYEPPLEARLRDNTEAKRKIGKDMENMLSRYCVDKVFLSAKTLDLSNGIYDASIEEGTAKQAFMGAGKYIFCLTTRRLGLRHFTKCAI